MKTSKETFEIRIKKQIDEREISPSRSLWAEIEVQIQTPEEKRTKKINWFLVAACFILLVSLGTVLLLKSDENPKVILAQKTVVQPIESTKIQHKITPEKIRKTEKAENFSSNIEIVSAEKTEGVLSPEKDIKPEIPLSDEPKMQSDVLPAENILAKTDTVPMKKRKKYVDPATLLFSVEHKDAIEHTKDGSNVAKIDLNSK